MDDDSELERNARNLLRPDNYDLFEQVRLELNARNPVIPIDDIASRLCVSVDDLCRWVIGFKEPTVKRKQFYQAPAFAPLRPPKVSPPDAWADDEYRRKQRFAQKARDGARATILALEKADG
jgi:hypothetical protein